MTQNPEYIINLLEKTIRYQLKGTGQIKYHLGCDYFRDAHNILCYATKKYIDKLILDYIKLFGQNTKPYWSPLEKKDSQLQRIRRKGHQNLPINDRFITLGSIFSKI